MTNSLTHQPFDNEKFESAFQAILQQKKKDHPIYVGGMKVASGHEFVVKSPIDDTIGFGTFQEPEDGTVAWAVDVAAKIHPTWSGTPLQSRIKYFADLLEIVKVQRYRLAAMVLLSSGMTGRESVAEVDRLIEVLSECVSIKDLKKGKTGIWGIITSYNSPLASPLGHAIAAMIAGNCVIVAPSKNCPEPVYMVYDMMETATLPSGVMNLMIDRTNRTYGQLANNPDIEGILISGSAEYLDEMMFLQVDDELKVLNELKGMNPIIVHRPGDIKGIADEILSSAFRYSGQRLFSSSKMIITAEDSNKVISTLLEKAGELKISDPAEAGTFSGPIISEENAKRFILRSREVKGNILFGAKKVNDELTQNGQYYTPMIVTGLGDENELMFMDSGLPILCVKTVKDFDAAMEELENTECGLSAGLMSKDQRAIERFKAEADVMYKFINKGNTDLKPAVYASLEAFLK